MPALAGTTGTKLPLTTLIFSWKAEGETCVVTDLASRYLTQEQATTHFALPVVDALTAVPHSLLHSGPSSCRSVQYSETSPHIRRRIAGRRSDHRQERRASYSCGWRFHHPLR